MTLHTIASGSEGNCLLVCCGETHILVDAGISARRITAALAALGLTAADVDAILKAVPEIVSYLRGFSPIWQDLESGRRTHLL